MLLMHTQHNRNRATVDRGNLSPFKKSRTRIGAADQVDAVAWEWFPCGLTLPDLAFYKKVKIIYVKCKPCIVMRTVTLL